MEESITIDELYLLLKVTHEDEYSKRKFAAALKGIDLDEDDESEDRSFEDIRQEADAILAGQGGKPSEHYVDMNDILDFDTDDE